MISSRRFGIEFEVECEWKALKHHAVRAIDRLYRSKRYYAREDTFQSDFQTNKWHIKEENGILSELTTPISTCRSLSKICQVVQSLARNKIRANSNCGLHIHLDIPDMTKFHFMACWLLHEQAILKCFSRQRRTCGHCDMFLTHPTNKKKQIAQILTEMTDSARHGNVVSLDEYDERQTVEIRICEGTTDHRWIETWVRFIVGLVDFFAQSDGTYIACQKCASVDFHPMLDKLDLPIEHKRRMIDRYSKHHAEPYW